MSDMEIYSVEPCNIRRGEAESDKCVNSVYSEGRSGILVSYRFRDRWRQLSPIGGACAKRKAIKGTIAFTPHLGLFTRKVGEVGRTKSANFQQKSVKQIREAQSHRL